MATATREPQLTYEIDPDIQEQLGTYRPGEWIALTPSKIVAVRETATEAYEAARAEGIDAPILYQVPTHEPGAYYF